MKATELRIGNYVYHTDAGEIQVNKTDIAEYEICYETLIEPIPLAEEWLQKFGFIENIKDVPYQPSYSINIRLTIFYLRPSYKGGYYWGFMNDGKDCELNDVLNIKYVHELQNLYFVLTNQELEIKK